jgi:hypothetical protein
MMAEERKPRQILGARPIGKRHGRMWLKNWEERREKL